MSSQHPINGLMETAMENIKDMVDVNTIVGEPVQTPDGSVILPISKVNFGFAAGGSEFNNTEESGNNSNKQNTSGQDAQNAFVSLPFGGGSGGGVSITPIAFLVVGTQGVKVVPLDNQTHILERLIDAAPQWVDKLRNTFQKGTDPMGMSTTGAAKGTSNPIPNIISSPTNDNIM
ncbi:GerW family sporulation protein [Cohnella sp.]|uniref:GerW family sporulation protein n=1 Tax=Cohnella sp. TaxID=1883426 RepID=UPI00356509E5